MKTPGYVLRTLSRWAILTALLTAGLFLAAGTTQVISLRAYIVVFSAMLLVTMLAVCPELAQERANPGSEGKDQGVRFASGFLFLVTVGAAAMDVGRLHQSDNVPPAFRIVALTIFTASLALQAWAMIVNPFFSPTIRIQSERSHCVVRSGPYRFLRHPGYLAMLIAIPASALAIGSSLALIPAAGFGLVIVRRARLEDQFLKRKLAGYIDYMERVPAGLFPRLTLVRFAVLVLVALALLVAGLVYAASANSTADLKLPFSAFNEQRAFEELKYLASLGPRPPGADPHERATMYIFSSLLAAGVDIRAVNNLIV